MLQATDLNSWLNNIQSVIPGKITFIYDACQSGSFLPLLVPPSGKERILIASTSEGQSAYFTSKGSLSFSSLFWEHVFNGMNLDDTFISAKDAVQYTYKNQSPLLDDNGNGIGNENADGDLAKTISIGNGVFSAGDIPSIGAASPGQTLNGQTSASIYADNVIDSDGIKRVWAVITPPNFDPGDPDSPVLSLPVLEMTDVGNNRFEGTYMDFNMTGTYNLAIYAKDSNDTLSLPQKITITQTGQTFASIGSGLKIIIPSLDFQGNDYQVTLNYYPNPSDTDNYFWKLDANSVGVGQNCSGDCASVDSNWQIIIPKIEFEGNFYQINLKYYQHPNNPSDFHWMLDLSSITIL